MRSFQAGFIRRTTFCRESACSYLAETISHSHSRATGFPLFTWSPDLYRHISREHLRPSINDHARSSILVWVHHCAVVPWCLVRVLVAVPHFTEAFPYPSRVPYAASPPVSPVSFLVRRRYASPSAARTFLHCEICSCSPANQSAGGCLQPG